MAPTASSSSSLSMFTILPLALPRLGTLPPELQQATHYLYIRPHAPKISDVDTSRSLFAANVPCDANESNLRKLFADHLGGTRIERVEFDARDMINGPVGSTPAKSKEGGAQAASGATAVQSRGKKRKRNRDAEGELDEPELRLPQVEGLGILKSGANAVLVFVDKASADVAMEACKKAAALAKKKAKATIEWDNGGCVTGLERYKRIHQARYPDPAALLSSVTLYLMAFDKREAAQKRAIERARTVPDEDGFITVARGGRTGPARVEEAKEALKKEEERAKSRVSDGFYRFQVREKQKEKARELKRHFAEDVKRVEEKRKRRKVKWQG